MTRKAGHIVLIAAAAALCLSGCGQRVQEQTETETEKKKEPEVVTEAMTERVMLSTEAETEAPVKTEPQKLITSVDYTSKDGSVKITLPDNTWKVTQDADEMRVFQSGNDAIINIVHADTQTAMKSLTVMTAREELEASLVKQYQDEEAYEIVDYASVTMDDTIQVCRYTVKYNAPARMWAYAVTNAVIDGEDEAYVVTGTVTDDNSTLLDAVKKAVESFRVLNNETLRKVTGEVITGTPQVTSEEVKTGTVSAEELESLVEYGSSAPLVTNDSVNVRLTPGTDGGVLTTLNKGDTVTVTGETNNWFKVDIGGNAGYIRKDFLIYPEDAAKSGTDTAGADAGTQAAGEASQTGSGTMTASSEVNVRSAPGTDSDVIDVLSVGQSVTVLGESDGWLMISVNGQTGYVAQNYMTSAGSQPAQNADSSAGDGQDASGSDEGGSADNTASADNTGTGENSSASESSSPTSLGGTIISSSIDSFTIQADDGSTRTIYYGDAAVSSNDGLYEGVYVELGLDPSQTGGDGTLYALNVTGY